MEKARNYQEESLIWNLQYCSQVSSVQFSSVQFSSVQFKMAVPRRPSLPDPSGASDREGTARRNWHGWTMV